MKTQEQKLQYVMEAAGECWHNVQERIAASKALNHKEG